MEHSELLELKNQIASTFNITQLRQVVWDAGVDYENLSHSNLSSLARETVGYFHRHARLQDLVLSCAKHAPTVDWSRWGGPLPVEDLHSVLRQLLNQAFSVSNIYALAFDVLVEIYDEVRSAQSKARAIEMVVQTAVNSNRVIPLLNWVRRNNSYQYSTYFERVDKALSAHLNKPQEPAQPTTSSKKHQSDAQSVVVMVLKQYASGHWDGGNLAKSALELLGEEIV